MNAAALRSLASFSKALREAPTRVAQETAARAAPKLTEIAHEDFNASRDPSGVPWPLGKQDQTVKLRRNDDLFKRVYYVAKGTLLRVSLGVKHAKYQIGRFRVFPRQGEQLPPKYRAALAGTFVEVFQEFARGER